MEVMQSHLKGGRLQQNWKRSGGPVCGRLYGSRFQPRILEKVVTAKGRETADLTQAEYCAAHLVRNFCHLL